MTTPATPPADTAYARLLALAAKATPGPWHVPEPGDHPFELPRVYSPDTLIAEIGNADLPIDALDQWDANAVFIAACDPKTITALVTALSQAVAREAGLRAAVLRSWLQHDIDDYAFCAHCDGDVKWEPETFVHNQNCIVLRPPISGGE